MGKSREEFCNNYVTMSVSEVLKEKVVINGKNFSISLLKYCHNHWKYQQLNCKDCFIDNSPSYLVLFKNLTLNIDLQAVIHSLIREFFLMKSAQY